MAQPKSRKYGYIKRNFEIAADCGDIEALDRLADEAFLQIEVRGDRVDVEPFVKLFNAIDCVKLDLEQRQGLDNRGEV